MNCTVSGTAAKVDPQTQSHIASSARLKLLHIEKPLRPCLRCRTSMQPEKLADATQYFTMPPRHLGSPAFGIQGLAHGLQFDFTHGEYA